MSRIFEETKNILNKNNIKANKSLGQNFLIDDEVVEKIVNSANIEKDDLVIEIGPGLGTLTEFLLERAKKVICIELDKRMVNVLKNRFIGKENIEIINEDVLKVDIKELIKNEKEKNQIKNAKIVANLPYYITTPIITKLLEDRLDLESITVMIQKEVADRLIETPGGKKTGAVTYCIYYFCQSEKITEVSKDCFIPKPEVTSEVIKLNIREEVAVDVKVPSIMFKIIKCAFMQRRKTLLNSLTNAKVFKDKEEGIRILNSLNLNMNIRPENLRIEDYANITNEFLKSVKPN